MNTPQRALAAAVSTAALLVGLVACGGSDSADSSASSNSAAAGGAQAQGTESDEGDEGADEVETPLTGEAKEKAEAAALAAFPGTVVKSEEDAENPGMYAVEIKKADGSEVEVYLDPKTYKVVKTKDEAADDEN